MSLTSLKRHPLSAIWGDMDPDQFEALKQDVGHVGVREPITLFDGMVLDGWHRLQAAIQSGLSVVPTNEYDGNDPAAFVVRRNGLRKQVSKEQVAVYTCESYDWLGSGAPAKTDHDDPVSRTNEELATIAGCSVPTIKRAKRVIREGQADAIRAGDATFSRLARDRRTANREDAGRDETMDRQRQTPMGKLMAENEELRAAVDAANDENDRLRAENERLTGAIEELQAQLETEGSDKE